MAGPSILKTIIHGLVTSLGLRIIAMALRFAVIVLLPLWLSPVEVGYTALILVFVNLSISFADLGYGTAIIKDKSADTRTFQSVFTLVTAMSLFLSLALILCASPIETHFGLPAIFALLASFAIPFNGIAIIPNAILQRDLRFGNLAVRDLIGEVAFSATTLIMALNGYGAYSVAVAVILQRAVRWAIASISVSWNPRLVWPLPTLKRLFRFSFFQFLALAMVQLFNQIDKLLLAAYLPPMSIGFYAQAQQFTVAPIQSLTGTANNVFFASFSKVQDEDETLRRLFLKILKYFIPLTCLGTGLLAPAMHLVPWLYNESWRDAVPAAITLCAFLPAFCAYIFEGMMIAIGGERRRVISSAVKLAMLIIGCIAGFALFPTLDGSVLMAAVLGLAMFSSVCINFYYIVRRLDLHIKHFKPLIPLSIIGFLFYLSGIIAALYIF